MAQGTDFLPARTRETISWMLDTLYSKNSFHMELFEDLELASSRWKEYRDIGLGEFRVSVMNYLTDNAFWINVCLFVNEDFRSCFNDAIMIEQALLQVNDDEYEAFRDDMTLASERRPRNERTLALRFDPFVEGISSGIGSRVTNGRMTFASAGMVDAYNDILKGMGTKAMRETSYIVYHFIYVFNAMSHNGVFFKYVHLVVDSVRKQLSAPEGA